MDIDSTSLIAKQSYTQIQERPKLDAEQTPMVKANSFHESVERQFNSFANLSSDQILKRIQAASGADSNASTAISGSSKSFAGSAAKSLRGSISNHENTARKSLIGEASLVELLTATTEAKNTLETTVKIRDKFIEAFDKVMNMAM